MLDIDVTGRNGDFTLDAALRSGTGITVLFGRSGAGKSTLINMLAGLKRPESGRIRLGETTVFDSEMGIDLPPEARSAGYVFQDDRLFPHYRVRGNLEYGLKRRRRRPLRHSFDDVVDLLEVSDLLDRRPETLSGGERQRIAIGRALLSQPSALLLDEPLSSLDVASREQVIPFIGRLGAEIALPIVYVSHSIEEVVRLGDTMALMSAGRIVETGPVEDIMSRLDLRPLTGRHESGSVINATLVEHDERFGLCALRFGDGQRLWVPGLDLPSGSSFRIRVRARDVALATKRPDETSIVNIFEGTVVDIAEIVDGDDVVQVDVLVDVGVPLTARITRKSMETLNLSPGRQVFAMVKAVAADRRSLGQPTRTHSRP